MSLHSSHVSPLFNLICQNTDMKLSTQNLGQRQTPQRDAILRVIEAASGPLSVPEIHALSQKTMPKLGIATIYRTIKLLLDAEQIQSVILPSGEARYERAGMGHHDHFQCRKCQHVFDLDICPSGLHNGMTLPGGYVVEDHEMIVYGLCANCSTPQKTAPKRRVASQASVKNTAK